MNAFVYDICKLLGDSSPLFVFGEGNTNLKVGELVRGENGVFAIQSGGDLPDLYNPIQDFVLDFWAINADSFEAHEQLLAIYNFFHQKHHYNTQSYTIYFSNAISNILDMDRNAEGRKMMKLSVRFIGTTIIS